jgi:hypothetical protein
MASRRVMLIAVVAAALATACSRGNPERAMSGSPVAPSGIGGAATGGSLGVSVPLDIGSPSRADVFEFRRSLETKYATGLGRSAQPSFVDIEGDAVWTQEYVRLRVNGCDHATAVQRVLAQIDGGPPASACAAVPEGVEVGLPPRGDLLDFRRQLEAKYQAMGRGASMTAVDLEGSAIWIPEYLRYRLNGCDHATALQKVFAQIDGGGVQPTCYVPCRYRVFTPFVTVPAEGGTFTAELIRDSGPNTCGWTASSQSTWLTLIAPTAGVDRETQRYSVALNPGGPRTGFIQFDYMGGSTRLEVYQTSSPFNLTFLFYDYSRSTNSTTECQLRRPNTPCTLVASTTSLPQAVASYYWYVVYNYGGVKVVTQTSASNTLTFTESCGAQEGPVDLSVTLTATDAAGNTATVYAGQGFQPALQLRVFACP